MNDRLTTKMVAVFTTTRCSLNCKYCGSQVPKFAKENIYISFDMKQMKESIDALFALYDYIGHIDVTGGEPLLMQNMDDEAGNLSGLISHIDRYHGQYGFLRVLTNGTILPNANLLETIKKLKGTFDFYLDNYEGLSHKAEEFKDLCDAEGISYKEIVYGKNSQYCEGWIDFGNLEYKGYSEKERKAVYDRCLQAHHSCLLLFDGTLYPCTIAPLASRLGKFPSSHCGGVDLLSKYETKDEKQTALGQFGNKVLEACDYCNGFDEKNAPRFPAAEQA